MKEQYIHILPKYPTFKQGKYRLKASSKISATSEISTLTQEFEIGMLPFSISEERIYSVYPIENSTGVYQDLIPHITFNSPSYPWERSLSFDKNNDYPFVFLFVFSEDEDIIFSTSKFDNSIKVSNELLLTLNENKDQTFDFIEIEKNLFINCCPTLEDLKYVAHSRKVSLDNKVTDKLVKSEWFSVIIANRFPKSGSKNYGVLVSLEGVEEYLLGAKPTQNYVKMFCLKKFEFASLHKNYDFITITENLDCNVFRNNIKNIPNELKKEIESGYTPLNYTFREGSKLLAWYRSPFIPYKPLGVNSIKLCQYPDGLMNYFNSSELLDVTYSASWQLGKLLALSNTQYANNLYNYRTTNKIKRAKEIEQECLGEMFESSTYHLQNRVNEELRNNIDKMSDICGESSPYEMNNLVEKVNVNTVDNNLKNIILKFNIKDKT